MRIYTDPHGLAVNAISRTSDDFDVEGSAYMVLIENNTLFVNFQRGPVEHDGVTGLTTPAVLAMLIHREQLLSKKQPSRERSLALTKLEEAAMWLGGIDKSVELKELKRAAAQLAVDRADLRAMLARAVADYDRPNCLYRGEMKCDWVEDAREMIGTTAAKEAA